MHHRRDTRVSCVACKSNITRKTWKHLRLKLHQLATQTQTVVKRRRIHTVPFPRWLTIHHLDFSLGRNIFCWQKHKRKLSKHTYVWTWEPSAKRKQKGQAFIALAHKPASHWYICACARMCEPAFEKAGLQLCYLNSKLFKLQINLHSTKSTQICNARLQ